MNIRIGIGFDTHRLTNDRPMIIGGEIINHHLGFHGHSDADLLTHAIIDALFGAANMHDIGYHFPDNDPQYKNISSLVLLEKCQELLSNEGWTINNIDTILILEKPKILPYIDKIKQNLATALHISTEQISVKAKTSEKIGFIGREEGANAYAIALIQK